MTDSVFFDLDGTLWDCTANSARAWQTVISALPEQCVPPTREQIRACCGLTLPEITDRVLPGIPKDRALEIGTACLAAEPEIIYANGGELYPGLVETLEILRRRYPLFVVSNCSPAYLEAFLKRHEMTAYFTETAAYGGPGKAKADNVARIARGRGLKHPVYVGDTIMDYEAACKAGTAFVHATYGFGQVPQAQWRVDFLPELPGVLEKM